MDIDSTASTVGSTPNLASVETPVLGQQDTEITPVAVAAPPAPAPAAPVAIVTEETTTVVIPTPPFAVVETPEKPQAPYHQDQQPSWMPEPVSVVEQVMTTTTTTTTTTSESETPINPETVETTPADTLILPSS